MPSRPTAEFAHEFELERERRLRRRLLWFVGVSAAMILFSVVVNILARIFGAEGAGRFAPTPLIIVSAVSASVSIGVFIYAFTRKFSPRSSVIHVVYFQIIVSGIIKLAPAILANDMMNKALHTQFGFQGHVGIGFTWLLNVMITHILASLFIPWTPREAVKPLIPLWILECILLAFAPDPILERILVALLSPLIAIPGALIAWRGHRRFRARFHQESVQGRYTELKQELSDARRLHESLFPPPLERGPVQMHFAYEPMRQIGGDFLYLNHNPANPDSPVSIVVVDVTGHGVPAALTVNRLHGELERIFAEHPDATPGDVLTSLNRYIHLTLARHSVYVTAIGARIDPSRGVAGVAQWASAGHPPAFLRRASGAIERLDSTAFILGVADGADFDPAPLTTQFAPGDTLIMYTDGATESRDSEGHMLRVEGLERLVAQCPARNSGSSSLANNILSAVTSRREGPPADDTLIVQITRHATSA